MLEQKELKRVLDYDPNTGVFKWKLRKGRGRIGSVAGYSNNQGYIFIGIDGIKQKAHRLAWLYVYGKFPEDQTDHINRIKTDNRIENLRDVSHKVNMRNKNIYRNNTSGVPGLQWNKKNKAWMAFIYNNGKRILLGYSKNKEDAIKARKDGELYYYRS